MQKEYFLETLNKLEFALRETLKAFACFSGALTAELSKEQPFTTTNSSPPSYDGAKNSTKNTDKGQFFLPEQKEEKMPKHKNIYVYRRKDGYYVASVVVKNTRKSFSGKSKTVVFSKAKEFLSKIVKYTSPGDYKNFNQLAEFYLNQVKKPFISTAYFNSLNYSFEKYVKTSFSKLKAEDISPIFLQQYFTTLCAKSTRIAEDVKTLLKQVFEYAIGNNIITANPMRAVLVKKHYRSNGKALSPEELEKFKNEIDNKPVYRLPFLIFLYTGVRRSEFKSIEFDFSSGFLTVDNAKLKEHQKANKDALKRKIPILKPLMELKSEIILDKWRNVSLDELHKTFAQIMPGMRLNYLRHTFQTYCRVFASKEMVNLWSGHSLGKDMTDRVYNHIPEAEQLKIVKEIEY